MEKVRVGILGAAGYTGGELIRVLLNHPQAEIVFANSESNAGNKVYAVHEGLIGETEMEYKVSVVKDSTTATETDFTLPQSFKFQPKSAIDTFYVQLHYSEKLDTEQLKLTLQIEPNENFKEGEEAYLMSVIVFHNNLVKPEWWSTTYFGTYTNLKYKYFLQVIQKDLTDVDNSTKRHYALMFKAWLEEQAAAGSPIKEEDGTLMTIPAGGGNK